MENLESIAYAKIQAAVDRRLDFLATNIAAVRGEMNSRGLLHSTLTVQKINEACVSLFNQVLDEIKREYEVILKETFWLSDSLTSRLVLNANTYFDRLTALAQAETKNAAHHLANDAMWRPFVDAISIAHQRALIDLSLYIDGSRNVGARKILRGVLQFAPKILLRLLGWKS